VAIPDPKAGGAARTSAVNSNTAARTLEADDEAVGHRRGNTAGFLLSLELGDLVEASILERASKSGCVHREMGASW
jgi:hypothetical protein